jgi:hypothetical protein
MAHGSTANANIATVKSTCDSLECSPSHRSQTSNVYAHGGKTVKQAKVTRGKTHAGHRGTKETPQKLSGMHHKRGH